MMIDQVEDDSTVILPRMMQGYYTITEVLGRVFNLLNFVITF